MKRGTPEHPKTLALAAKLGLRRYAAVGLLESLWHMTARYAPQGDIGRFDAATIARHLDYPNGTRLVEALVEAGWLDWFPDSKDEKKTLIVHDWHEHSEEYADKYLAYHKMLYANGKPPRKGIKKTTVDGKEPPINTDSPPIKTDSSEKSGEDKDNGGKSRVGQNQNQNQNQVSVSDGVTGDGDEAFRMLKTRPELSRLTYEQDYKARSDFDADLKFNDPGWLEIARWVAGEAVLSGPTIEMPGRWLRYQYARWFLDHKKNGAPGGDADPQGRRFKGHGE